MPRTPPPKKAPARALPETPRILCVSDRVIPEGSTSVYEVTRISGDARSADLCLRGTNFERFRVSVASLKIIYRSRCYVPAMGATFTLAAIPWLLPQGELKGYLEYVTFIATDGAYTKKWSSTNTGTFAEDFAKIVPPANAQDILEQLRRGETVLFAGLFELDQVLRLAC